MLTIHGLKKTYRKNAVAVRVLQGVDLDVRAGEFLAIVGASGSGKSTLLHLIGTLDTPDEGAVALNGQRIDHLPPKPREWLRNRTFGFIFQFYHLLPELTALENVLVPAMIAQSATGWLWQRRKLRRRAGELLERFGLGHRLHHLPRELSGGEMQRTAIARALMNRPAILLADEPTGNLDADTGNEIVRILRELNRQDGVTIVMVTHNMEIAAGCDRIVKLTNGRIERSAVAV
jgi:lipoprotein-releasing system ATP-binding protein